MRLIKVDNNLPTMRGADSQTVAGHKTRLGARRIALLETVRGQKLARHPSSSDIKRIAKAYGKKWRDLIK